MMPETVGPQHWDDAACIGADPDVWFPTSVMAAAADEARTVCVPCPARSRCLTYAIDTHQPGVWGGTTGPERQALTRGRDTLAAIDGRWRARQAAQQLGLPLAQAAHDHEVELMDDIIDTVADAHGIARATLLSGTRSSKVAAARREAIGRTCATTRVPLEDVAATFGRSLSTVSQAAQWWQRQTGDPR